MEYKEFRQNVLDNLEDAAFNKAICETLLNQKYFNGIGNYLRSVKASMVNKHFSTG